ncbi:MAG: fibronectin type III domain-containing protein, partial [Planctomycetota bacterium]
MSLTSSNWAARAFQGAFQKAFSSDPHPGKIQTRRRRSRRSAQQIVIESLEPRQMLSVNPASSGSCASSATDNSNIAAFVSQNSIGILSTVPGKPTSVVAVRGNASLAVTWTAPASTGGSAITDYLLKYSSDGGSTWTNFVHPVSTVPSLTVTGLTNGTAYVIKLIAKNAVGISLPSANSAPATPATVPGSPTSVVAVRGNASLAVTWTAPATTGGSNITDYLVKYSSNGGSMWTNFVHPVSTVPSLTVTGLTNGAAYVIKVIAKNAVGSSLPSANSAPVTPTSMSMVTVGNPGNAADTTGYGAVSYSYQIGKYDVTGS